MAAAAQTNFMADHGNGTRIATWSSIMRTPFLILLAPVLLALAAVIAGCDDNDQASLTGDAAEAVTGVSGEPQ